MTDTDAANATTSGIASGCRGGCRGGRRRLRDSGKWWLMFSNKTNKTRRRTSDQGRATIRSR